MLDNDTDGAMGAAMAFKGIVGRKAWTKAVLGKSLPIRQTFPTGEAVRS